MSDKKTYLFTLTITPVQSFISQARKTKDLFVGSAILSNLMKQVLGSEVLTSPNIEFIFPYIPDKKIDEVKTSFPNKMVVKIKDTREDKVRELGENLKKDINKKFLNLIFKITCQYQSSYENFFTVFWVAVELGDDYQKSYKQLEQNLGAVKNIRTFTQDHQDKGEQKCSICGERNWSKKDKKDKLCLICYTKRIYSKDEDKSSFPSTANIVLNDYEKSAEEAQKYLEDNPSEKKYYALIQFDIDDMGKKLSSLDEDGQKDLSKQLGEFAQKVGSEVLTSQKGKTIYAGGDDFLGFVNLEYLFDVLQEIKTEFLIPDMTFSIGVVIAHYKEPLHIVLNRVRSVEKMAKEIDKDKNGLAIAVLKHSGEMVETRVKNELENIQNISQFIQLLEEDFSDKFIINLELEFRSLVDENDKLMVKKEMLEVELKRLIKKSLLDKTEQTKIDELFNLLTPFIEYRKMSNFFSLLNSIRFMTRGLK